MEGAGKVSWEWENAVTGENLGIDIDGDGGGEMGNQWSSEGWVQEVGVGNAAAGENLGM